MNKKEFPAKIILNILIVLLCAIGTAAMLRGKPEEASLTASGIENFKFYTVLTNVFLGIASLIDLVFCFRKQSPSWLIPVRLAGVCGVTITFAVVAFFFGPLYGFPQFYKGGNLYFHLLEPIAAIVEFIAVKRGTITFRHTVIAAVPTLIYGCGYLGNILINGIGGPWPDTNDFYGFVNWGYPVGVLIFISITLIAFGTACIFRKINNRT